MDTTMNLSAITLRLEPQHLGLKINVNRLGHRGFGGQEAKIGLPWQGSPIRAFWGGLLKLAPLRSPGGNSPR